jgi:hypothetical protein
MPAPTTFDELARAVNRGGPALNFVGGRDILPRMPEPMLFQTSDDELLISVYQRQGRTLDDLPYTEHFEAIFSAVVGDRTDQEPYAALTRSALFRRLHNLRKAGRLPRLGRAIASPPRLDPQCEQKLIELVEAEIGKLSLRDQLPYSNQFERIVTTFNAQASLNLSLHDAWRIIAKAAK